MASGIFAILDDIAALMDDVAIASKIATKKTAGILGDDLAVNAEKATGFLSSREIPVLWAITKGSFLNKLIIVPVALLLNFFFPIAIKFILILGGCYLAFEGVEKIIHYIFHKKKENESTVEVLIDDQKAEKAKIKSAVLTDFILSVEIVIIALGTVVERDASVTVQILSVSVVAFLATVGVYGVVALIVRMDDAGYQIIKKSEDKGFLAKLGHFLVKALPYVIRILAFVGTIALLLVSGGIFSHNIDFFHHLLPDLNSTIKEFGLGFIIGLVVVVIVTITQKAYKLAVKK
ncbi:DUF808 domain-containing protein [Paenimyroides tangerinum]|uniref:DUF808 domain-containing protein n=1 Tax=Paenimyroides tangerinum TaxID=2488728 RepID=A0A3P3W3I0_9FLAO|nr:DUF808 domain-containing protein [Paenimyroides tangerinum]RRJ89520.1 DUF808 domain-containing protein [Paenimyroides tangerinum]